MPLYHHQVSTSDVYVPTGKTMPTGAVFYAPLSSASATAATGQTLTAKGTATYQNQQGINCVYFNGSSSYIYIPEALADTFPGLSSKDTLAYCCWFNTKNKNAGQEIISCTEGGGFSIGLNSDGNSGYMHIYVMAGGSYLNENICPISKVKQDQWMFICVNYNGSTVDVYLDNEKVNSFNKTGNLGMPNNAPLAIGAESADLSTTFSSDCFNGYISSVRVYDRALTQSEITTLSQEFALAVETSGFDELGHPVQYDSAFDAGCSLSYSWVDENTILYIPMYGNSPFTDKSQNQYSVTNNGVTAVTNVAPPSGGTGAGYLNSTNHYLYTGINILNGLTTFTLEFDFRLTQIPSGGNDWDDGYYFAANGNNYDNPGCDMYFGTSQIVLNFDNYNNRVGTSYTPDTNWHNLKITRDSSNLVSVYIDGVLINSYTRSNSFYSGSYGFAIGRVEPQGETGGAGFHGYIANYRISNIVR